MVPLDLLIKFINELSIRYSETQKVAFGGIFNTIKVYHLHFVLPPLATVHLNSIKQRGTQTKPRMVVEVAEEIK